MDTQKRSLWIFSGLLVVFFACFVFAAHTITPTTKSVAEDISVAYNITVNNTDAGQLANITQVNVTLPATFALTSNTNGTTAGALFSNTTSRILTWANATGFVVNGTSSQYFWFNATASTPGTYILTVTTLNLTGVFSSNISVTVNDTSKPTPVTFVNYTNSSASVLPNSYINFNVSAEDNVGVTYIRVYLYNSTGLVNSSATSASSPFAGRFINLPNGTYFLNASANDSAGNMNWTATWNFTVHDIVAPNITLTASETAQTSLTIAVAFVNEPYSGAQTCSVGTTAGVLTGSGLSWTITSAELTCATEYLVAVNCSDWAGNYGTKSVFFTTSACSAAAASTGGSSRLSPSYSPSNGQLAEGYKVQISKNTNVKLSGGHNFKLTDVSSSGSVTFTISSNPVTDTLAVGQTKNYDVDSDGYYDFKVYVKAVSGGKASLVITSIHEQMSPGSSSVATAQSQSQSQEPREAERQYSPPSEASSTNWWLVIGGLVLIVVIVVIVMVTSKKKNKRSSFR